MELGKTSIMDSLMSKTTISIEPHLDMVEPVEEVKKEEPKVELTPREQRTADRQAHRNQKKGL